MPLADGLRELPDLLFVGDVEFVGVGGAAEDGLGTAGAGSRDVHERHRLAGTVEILVGDDDDGAFGGEGDRRRPADPATAAGDDDEGAGQVAQTAA